MLNTASHVAVPARRSLASVAGLLLALGVAAALAVDAYVHLHDAADYSAVRTSVLSQADLFRIEAGLAIVLAVVVLAWPRLWAWLAAALLLAGAATAVLVYTYVDVGQIGPVPDMYE